MTVTVGLGAGATVGVTVDVGLVDADGRGLGVVTAADGTGPEAAADVPSLHAVMPAASVRTAATAAIGVSRRPRAEVTVEPWGSMDIVTMHRSDQWTRTDDSRSESVGSYLRSEYSWELDLPELVRSCVARGRALSGRRHGHLGVLSSCCGLRVGFGGAIGGSRRY